MCCVNVCEGHCTDGMREQSSFNEADLQVPGRTRTQCLAGGQVCVRVQMCVCETNT